MLWMQKTVDQLQELFIAIWRCRSRELRGHDFEVQKKAALEATRAGVKRVYQESSGAAGAWSACILQNQPVEETLKWTKSHLDACLATAKVILEQSVDPG